MASRKAEKTQYIWCTFVRIATILYYTSLNWKHCSFYYYTTLLPQHIFQKNASGITPISTPITTFFWASLGCRMFQLSRTDHPSKSLDKPHYCRGTKHTQGTPEITVTQVFLHCHFLTSDQASHNNNCTAWWKQNHSSKTRQYLIWGFLVTYLWISFC